MANGGSDPGSGAVEPGTGGVAGISGRSAAVLARIAELGAGGLLGRDLERSTQILVGLTTVSLCINLIKITKFEWLGIYAEFPDRNRLLLSIFLGALTGLAALYYRESSDRDRVAKRVRLAVLAQWTHTERAYLERVAAAGRRGDDAVQGSAPEPEEVGPDARGSRKLAKATMKALASARGEFERQDRSMRRFPPVVIIGGFLFQAAGVVVGSL